MTLTRTYRDAWNGAIHAFHPPTGPAARSLRPAVAESPGSPVAAAVKKIAGKCRWLDGPRGR